MTTAANQRTAFGSSTIGAAIGAIAVLLVSGCATTIDGSAVAAMSPSTAVPPSTVVVQPNATAGGASAVTAACPLLPGGAVAAAFPKQVSGTVHATESIRKRDGGSVSYTCNYRDSRTVVVSVQAIVNDLSAFTVSDGTLLAKDDCVTPQPVPGAGVGATVCRSGEHPNVEHGRAFRVMGTKIVFVSIDAPYGPGSDRATTVLLQKIVSALPRR